MTLSFDLAPLLPWAVLAAFGGLGLLAVLPGLIRRRRGAWLRLAALALLLLALLNPLLRQEDRERLPGVVAVVLDRSPSQSLGDRNAQLEAARHALGERLAKLKGLDVRWIDGGTGEQEDGTQLFAALARGLADVPPERVAGAILVTDGQVHDIPKPEALGFQAPVHALVTGHAGERDRRISVSAAPRFGLVGQDAPVTFRVDDLGVPNAARARVRVTIRRDGETVETRTVTPGANITAPLGIKHAGRNIFEIEAEPLENELTTLNNRVALAVDGVREKLRVLLVSGEPHAGERTWRSLLKSDPSVDLVHFTILRPPEKQDGTPINQLSLIAFPTRELFSQKIDQFDLIIFDRYQRRGVLPVIYFDNIARYVRDGGALLIAAGPDYASRDSLFRTPLGAVLPAEPTGTVTETPFHPAVTERGRRHPVTRDLPGSGANPPRWSRWFRLVDVSEPMRGESVMSGPDARPLLQLSREEKGRVALFLSDHEWLWARGFEGGGPYVDLLRRLSHWLLKEPELEEEALRLVQHGHAITVERQTMADETEPVTLTLPSGAERSVALQKAEPGLWRASIQAAELGLYRARQGELTALAAVGPLNPREFQDAVSSTEKLAPLASATGGGVERLDQGHGLEIPRLVPMRAGAGMHGSGWLGLKITEASALKDIRTLPLFSGLLGLALLIGALGALWWREGR
jgi:hypothetical protein